MRSRMTFRRAAWASLLTLLLASGAALASSQEKKDGGKPGQEPRSERPSGDKAAGKDGATTEKKEADAGDTTIDLNTAAAAAAMLQQKGEIISQKGDLKIAVDSNFFTEFPGFELGDLDAPQRDKLVKQANSVYCTCGCRGDTVARCVVLDPSCQVARKMLQRMLDDIAPADPLASKKPSTE